MKAFLIATVSAMLIGCANNGLRPIEPDVIIHYGNHQTDLNNHRVVREELKKVVDNTIHNDEPYRWFILSDVDSGKELREIERRVELIKKHIGIEPILITRPTTYTHGQPTHELQLFYAPDNAENRGRMLSQYRVHTSEFNHSYAVSDYANFKAPYKAQQWYVDADNIFSQLHGLLKVYNWKIQDEVGLGKYQRSAFVMSVATLEPSFASAAEIKAVIENYSYQQSIELDFEINELTDTVVIKGFDQ